MGVLHVVMHYHHVGQKPGESVYQSVTVVRENRLPAPFGDVDKLEQHEVLEPNRSLR